MVAQEGADYLAKEDVVDYLRPLAAGQGSINNDRNRLRQVCPAAGSGSWSGSVSGSVSSNNTKKMMKTMPSVAVLLLCTTDVLVYIADLERYSQPALGEAMRRGARSF